MSSSNSIVLELGTTKVLSEFVAQFWAMFYFLIFSFLVFYSLLGTRLYFSFFFLLCPRARVRVCFKRGWGGVGFRSSSVSQFYVSMSRCILL